jgi:D-alanyl-D-alanine carboxypeptidase
MNEHAPRHPASVTKVMTLYLLFEQLEKGKLTLDSEIPISAHAAAQAPSKLGLRPGSTIRVEDAIKVIVTKSANDIAVAVAEAVGGSESEFAELMTHKAHALGMNQTLYRNASGLPNNEQITTAYDLAILGRDIQARFPRYYRYFALHEVAYHGQRIHTHNHLMDRVEGMDGIKTGYTVASGFNLLSSVKRDGHYLISVVLGGKTARARDSYMESLIEAHIDDAGGRGAVQVADKDDDAPQQAEAAPHGRETKADRSEAKEESRANVRPEPVRSEPARADTRPQDSERSQEPPRLQVAAVVPELHPRPAYIAAVSPPRRVAEDDRLDHDDATAAVRRRPALDGSTRSTHETSSVATPGGLRWIAGPPAAKRTARIEIPEKSDEGVSVRGKETAQNPASTREIAKDTAKDIATSKPAGGGWTIQIGATDDAAKAMALLKSAKEKRAALLASARPYTEAVRKGKDTLYRARFAGLQEARAEAACKALKSSGFSCFATRD